MAGDIVSDQIEKVARVAGRQITQIIPCRDDVVCIVDRSSLLVVTHDNDGKQDGVYITNLETGHSWPLLEQGRCYTCVLDEPSLAASPDGRRIAYVAEDATDLPDLWLSDAGLQSRRQLTRLNPHFDPRFMGRARLIEWLSDGGGRLKGALLLPSDYHPGRRYPLVTYVYGGALLSNRFDRFGLANTGPLNMQLFCDPRICSFLARYPATGGYSHAIPGENCRSWNQQSDRAGNCRSRAAGCYGPQLWWLQRSVSNCPNSQIQGGNGDSWRWRSARFLWRNGARRLIFWSGGG